MKIGAKSYGTSTLPRYEATVKMRLHDDIRIFYNNRPMQLKTLMVVMERPSGHGTDWTVTHVEGTGSYAKGRLDIDSMSDQQKQELLESVTDWRIATYAALDFPISEKIQQHIDNAIQMVTEDCAKADNG